MNGFVDGAGPCALMIESSRSSRLVILGADADPLADSELDTAAGLIAADLLFIRIAAIDGDEPVDGVIRAVTVHGYRLELAGARTRRAFAMPMQTSNDSTASGYPVRSRSEAESLHQGSFRSPGG